MPKAIINRDIEIRSRTRNVAWSLRASPYDQTLPQECIEIAIARGAATAVAPKRRGQKKASPARRGGKPASKTASAKGGEPETAAETSGT